MYSNNIGSLTRLRVAVLFLVASSGLFGCSQGGVKAENRVPGPVVRGKMVFVGSFERPAIYVAGFAAYIRKYQAAGWLAGLRDASLADPLSQSLYEKNPACTRGGIGAIPYRVRDVVAWYYSCNTMGPLHQSWKGEASWADRDLLIDKIISDVNNSPENVPKL